jgi:hypothetical protein
MNYPCSVTLPFQKFVVQFLYSVLINIPWFLVRLLFTQWTQNGESSYFTSQNIIASGTTVLFQRAKHSLPVDARAEKPRLALLLKMNCQLSLTILFFFKKWYLTIVNAQIQILLKCVQITVKLDVILNFLRQQLVSDTTCLETYILLYGFKVRSIYGTSK